MSFVISCPAMSVFEEVGTTGFTRLLCELASVFTLRRMAEGWPSSPPYPNWADLRSENCAGLRRDKYLSLRRASITYRA